MTTLRSAFVLFPGSSTLSLVSLLLIAGVTSIALLRASEDQTGGAVSGISSGFHEALSHGPGARATGGDKGVIAVADSHEPGAHATRDDEWLTSPRFGSQFGSRFDDGVSIRPEIDGNTDAFRNLLCELERFSLVSATETLSESIVLEIVNPEAMTEAALTIQLAELVRTAGCDSGRMDVEFELTLWSSSPSPAAWMLAAVDAEKLRSRVFSLTIASGLPVPKITSCSRIWREPSRLRPAVTVVVRKAR